MTDRRFIPVIDYIGNVLNYRDQNPLENNDGWKSFTICEQDDVSKAITQMRKIIKKRIEIGQRILISIPPRRIKGEPLFCHEPHIELFYKIKD